MIDAGGEFQPAFREMLKSYGVRAVVSRTFVMFVERTIRTLKEQIQLRQDALGDKNWTEYLPDVFEQYNSTERMTTQMELEEATQPRFAATVRDRIQRRATLNRKYVVLQIGDKVRVTRTAGNISQYKAKYKAWNQAIYIVADTHMLNGQTIYKLARGIGRVYEACIFEDGRLPGATRQGNACTGG